MWTCKLLITAAGEQGGAAQTSRSGLAERGGERPGPSHGPHTHRQEEQRGDPDNVWRVNVDPGNVVPANTYYPGNMT